ncbi:MAG: YidC/Oxa1 family membrane protein insertase, partial [Chloroflexota bacterium]|nr:YidC/Oxa1 family membrane protein insertase [Chloroflexota bacterium]
VQKKHKDPQQRAEEQMKLYRRYGVNPVGCLWPMLVQFPIWIGLYYSIMQALPTTPEAFLAMGEHIYPWLPLHQAIPLEERFLWMNLARPDPLPVMAFLVGITMWVQQKMTAMPSADEKQASMNQMMQWFMPAMFAVFTLSFPSGLAVYWVVSTVVGIIQQYPVTGWGSLRFTGWGSLRFRGFGSTPTAGPAPDKGSTPPAPPAEENPPAAIGAENGKPGDKRKDRGRRRRAGPGQAGEKPR